MKLSSILNQAVAFGFAVALFMVSGKALADGRALSLSSMSYDGVVPSSAALSLATGTAGVTNVIAVCWDAEDKGADFDDWANHKFLVYAPPEMTSATCEVPAAVKSGWNGAVKALRYFLVDGTPYKPGANAYVQRGLLAHFDGIENTAYGAAHDSTTNKWTDLSGHGYNWSLGAICQWEDNALYFKGAGAGGSNAKSAAADWSGVRTMEVLYKADELRGVLFTSSINNSLYSYISNNKISVTRNWGYPIDTARAYSFAAVYNEADLTANTGSFTGQMYKNGEAVTAVTIGDYWNTGSLNSIGNRRGGGGTTGNSQSKGHMYALRFYTEQLTAAEIAENYEIDKIRYLGAISLSDVLTLGATPVTTPASAPVAIAAASDDVTIGQVAKNAESYRFGDTVTLTATPLTALTQFKYWMGDLPDGVDEMQATITFTADRDRTITAHFSEVNVLYVRAGGNDATAVKNDQGHPYGTVNGAMAAATAGDMIDVGEGTFPLTAAVTLDKELTVKGAGTNETVITTSSTSIRAFVLSSASAIIRDLTVSNFVNTVDQKGSAVYMTAGKVIDCRLCWNSGKRSNPLGVALHLAGGTVRGCTFDHNTVKNGSSTRCGDSIYMTGGLVEDCVIRDNLVATENSQSSFHITGGVARRCRVYGNELKYTDSAAVYMTGGTFEDGTVFGNKPLGVRVAGAILRRTLVADNTSQGNAIATYTGAAGVALTAGLVERCTVVGNATYGDETACSGLSMSGGTARENIFWGNGNGLGGETVSGGTFVSNIVENAVSRGMDCLWTDPRFADAANGDYGLTANSPRKDWGAFPYAWGTGFACGISSEAGVVKAGTEVTFGAMVSGGEATFYAWYVDGVAAGSDETLTLSNVAAGRHAVRLVVSDGNGNSDDVTLPDAVVVRPTKTYASPNGSNTFPYDTSAKAAHSIEDALDAVWQEAGNLAEVEIAAGDYTNAHAIVCKYPIFVHGAGMDATVVRQKESGDRALVLTHADAVISNLTFTGFQNYMTGIGVSMSAGLLTHVRIDACKPPANRSGPTGGGISMSGGTVRHCRITNNSFASMSANKTGDQIYATGGLIEFCDIAGGHGGNANDKGGVYLAGAVTLRDSDIHGHYAPDTGSHTGGGLAIHHKDALAERVRVRACSPHGITMSAGTLRNALVCCNTNNLVNSAAYMYAGAWVYGGTVENCTFAGNVTKSDGAGDSGLYQTGGTVVNSIFYGNGYPGSAVGSAHVTGGAFATNLVDVAVASGVDCLTADPIFINATTNDYHLGVGSPAVDKGALREGVVDDLEGRAREGRPDLGCYEFDASAFPFSCGISVADIGLGDEARASVAVVGDTHPCACRWFVDGVEQEETGATLVFTPAVAGRHTVSVTVYEAVTGKSDTDSTTLTAYPLTTYADPDGGDEFPYDTPAKAAKNPVDAVGAVWSSSTSTGVVHVAAGDYGMNDAVSLAGHVRLLGAGADVTFFTATNTGFRALSVSAAGACARGITFRNYRSDLVSGKGLYVAAGTVEDCVVSNVDNVTWCYNHYGTGLHITGGEVRRTAFYKCSLASVGTSRAGVNVYQTGGLVEDCLMVGGATARNDGNLGSLYVAGGTNRHCVVCGYVSGEDNLTYGAIHLVDGLVDGCIVTGNQHYGVSVVGGTLRNALVACNEKIGTKIVTSGVRLAGGRMENCTVTTNGVFSGGSSEGLSMSAGRAVNNIVWGNGADALVVGSARVTGGTFNTNLVDVAVGTGVGNLVADPKLKTHFRRRWSPKAKSPAVDAGARLDWMTEWAVDLDGTPRVRDRAPDLGCYEVDLSGLLLIFR